MSLASVCWLILKCIGQTSRKVHSSPVVVVVVVVVVAHLDDVIIYYFILLFCYFMNWANTVIFSWSYRPCFDAWRQHYCHDADVEPNGRNWTTSKTGGTLFGRTVLEPQTETSEARRWGNPGVEARSHRSIQFIHSFTHSFITWIDSWVKPGSLVLFIIDDFFWKLIKLYNCFGF